MSGYLDYDTQPFELFKEGLLVVRFWKNARGVQMASVSSSEGEILLSAPIKRGRWDLSATPSGYRELVEGEYRKSLLNHIVGDRGEEVD